MPAPPDEIARPTEARRAHELTRDPAAERQRRVDLSQLADREGLEALQLVTDSVVQMAGFRVATLSLAHEGLWVSVADSGDPEVAELRGVPLAFDRVLDAIATGDSWGRFVFIAEEVSNLDPENFRWIPDLAPLDHPHAWRPRDVLVATLRDPSGEIVGLLALDVPIDGLRPQVGRRELLERYAVQAERTVVALLERRRLAEEMRLLATARELMRAATAEPTLDTLLTQSRLALTTGFNAEAIWMHIGHTADSGGGTIIGSHDSDYTVPEGYHAVLGENVRVLWEEQTVGVIGPYSVPRLLTADQHDEIRATMRSRGQSHMMIVPIGAGRDPLGFFILTRGEQRPQWSETEGDSALGVARDLGAALLNIRAFEQEQQLVESLRRLDSYKSKLIAGITHELKNPLSAIVGNTELLEGDPDMTEDQRGRLAAIGRGSSRLGRVVDGLLMLAQVGDPDLVLEMRPLDLRRIVRDVLDLESVVAATRGIFLECTVPETAWVFGELDQLHMVVGNLVSNAVKYSPHGGTVAVSADVGDEVVRLRVADDGLGISEADQEQLFTEFFRSTNPDALAQPGNGLGLTIVARIVKRHGGSVEIDSALGEGSRFTVTLPTTAQPMT